MNNRIKHLLKVLDEDYRAFAKKLGREPRHLKKMIKGKRKLDAELCRLIVTTFPVNGYWLLTGKGPALRNVPPSAASPCIQQGIHQHILWYLLYKYDAGVSGGLSDAGEDVEGKTDG